MTVDSSYPNDTDTKTVEVEVPRGKVTERRGSLHEPEERQKVSLQDGPSIALTHRAIRVYDPDFNEFVELDLSDLTLLFARIYDMDAGSETTDPQQENTTTEQGGGS